MSTTTFGQFDVVAYDWIDQEENPLVKIVETEDDEMMLEIVVGGGVMYLWPAGEIIRQINQAFHTTKPAEPASSEPSPQSPPVPSPELP